MPWMLLEVMVMVLNVSNAPVELHKHCVLGTISFMFDVVTCISALEGHTAMGDNGNGDGSSGVCDSISVDGFGMDRSEYVDSDGACCPGPRKRFWFYFASVGDHGGLDNFHNGSSSFDWLASPYVSPRLDRAAGSRFTSLLHGTANTRFLQVFIELRAIIFHIVSERF